MFLPALVLPMGGSHKGCRNGTLARCGPVYLKGCRSGALLTLRPGAEDWPRPK
jgi:hypothetical protein